MSDGSGDGERSAGDGPRSLLGGLVGTDRFGGLLVLLLVTLILFGAVRQIPFGGPLRSAAQGLALATAVRASGVPWRRTGLWMALGFIGVFAALVGDAIVASHTVPAVADVVSLLFSVLMGGVIARRLVHHAEIGVGTIVGAVCVYLVLGSVFASGFAIVAALQPGFFTTSHVQDLDYLYFSFGQLTTVGAPPLSPGTDLARMLGIIEALIGQIYLVTVIALLVGNLGRRRRA